MHWLLLIVRYVLRFLAGDEDSVSLAARIDGYVEQRRGWNAWGESGWSLFALGRTRDGACSRNEARRRRHLPKDHRPPTAGSPSGD